MTLASTALQTGWKLAPTPNALTISVMDTIPDHETVIPFSSPALIDAEKRYARLLARVTVEPGKMGGVPCVRGLRMPLSTILGALSEGLSTDQIIELFPTLEPDDILAACAYASEKIDALSDADRYGWMRLTEESLRKTWDTPEEDAAWADL